MGCGAVVVTPSGTAEDEDEDEVGSGPISVWIGKGPGKNVYMIPGRVVSSKTVDVWVSVT